jgi:hypothetical protein
MAADFLGDPGFLLASLEDMFGMSFRPATFCIAILRLMMPRRITKAPEKKMTALLSRGVDAMHLIGLAKNVGRTPSAESLTPPPGHFRAVARI